MIEVKSSRNLQELVGRIQEGQEQDRAILWQHHLLKKKDFPSTIVSSQANS